MRGFLIVGSALAALGVALGAFGAHILRDRLDAKRLDTFETGVRYQMYHALALLAVAFAISHYPGSSLPLAAGWLFVSGIVLFSFSLYTLALSNVRWVAIVTPVGGTAFVAGWICLLLTAWLEFGYP
jgi:uncharacterized membrane protein YgdD (TMEM256/DUF423 family)